MATAIAIEFLAGRYHATPWDRQVNEAEIEWPPSPWRLLRSFVAIWHRKISPSGDGEELLESLIERLAGDLPCYRLPAAIHAHSRHYMPYGNGSKTLVFDAWAAVDRGEELVVVWPNVDLPIAERTLFDQILQNLGYLGRSEGWVEARLRDWREPAASNGSAAEHAAGDQAGVDAAGVSTPHVTAIGPAGGLSNAVSRSSGARWDCLPAAYADASVSERSDPVRLPVPMATEQYRRWREERIREEGLDKGRLNHKERRLLATLPSRLIDALRLETADFRRVGWSDPPGCRFEIYHRRGDALEPRSVRAHRHGANRARGGTPARSRAQRPTTVRFALGGKPLPRVLDAVRIGEVMREALMAITDRRNPSADYVSQVDEGSSSDGGRFADRSPDVREALALLSGHDLPRGVEHAYYLPEDADGDARIDHILLHVPQGIPDAALRAVGHIRELWREADQRWPAVVEAVGTRQDFDAHRYLTRASEWVSVTPYLYPWFRKKGFGIEDQIKKECQLRGWGEPELEELPWIEVAGKRLRPIHFYRFRSKRGLVQPDRRGSFWRLRFANEIAGPVTLGFGRHYGLGMFSAT